MTSFGETKEAYTKFEPFRATIIWYEVLEEFRRKVPQQCNRFKKSSNTEELCFSGSSAVKTLETYLTENRQNLGMKEITKEKVIKLCQILINETVIEQVNTQSFVIDENKSKFQPTEQSFYRFCAKKSIEKGSLSFKDVMSPNLKNKDVCRNKPFSLLNGETGVYMTPNSCRSMNRTRDDSSEKKSSYFSSPTLHASIIKNSDKSSCSSSSHSTNLSNASFRQLSLDTDLSGYDDCMVYDLALFRLLTLIEIPVLDGILQIKSRQKNGVTSLEGIFANFGISSNNRKRIAPSFDLSDVERFEDKWIKFALSYLYETGVGGINLSELTDKWKSDCEKHLCIFRKVVETTKKLCKDDPYYPAEYDEVLKEIFDLLTKKRHTLALEACQLFVLLLPNEKRRRFHWLLKFLMCCNDCKETKLSFEMSNLQFALNQLKDTFVKCSSLTKSQSLEFFTFMVNNCREILKPPDTFQDQLFQRQFRQMYTVAEPDPGISYCQRITPAQFDRQKMDVSEEALVELVERVVHSLHMSLAEKIDWLDKFKREYPELFARRFNDLRW